MAAQTCTRKKGKTFTAIFVTGVYIFNMANPVMCTALIFLFDYILHKA